MAQGKGMRARNWAPDWIRDWLRVRDRGGAWCVCGWRTLALAVAATVLAVGWAQAQGARKGSDKADQSQQADEDGEAKDAQKKKKPSPVDAQAAIHGAMTLLDAGKAEQAAQSLTSTLAAGRLPPTAMAKALYYRGIAYRQLKKPAQAIADLTSALWLKGGLTESDRANALKQRAAAYQEAGLTENGEAIAAAVPQRAPLASPKAMTASTATWGEATTSPAPAASAAEQPSSGWNFFGNLFGAPSAPPPQPAPPPSAAAPPPPLSTAAIPSAGRSGGGWSRNTQVHDGVAESEPQALPVRDGKFRVQIGMVRGYDQAQALAMKAKSAYGAAFGSREAEIDQAVVGNMGSFYRVRFGPFASQQEGQAACARLKGSGLDCLVVTP
jgi:hypothetical protein